MLTIFLLQIFAEKSDEDNFKKSFTAFANKSTINFTKYDMLF